MHTFTAEELKTISWWAMEAADKAKKLLAYYPEPYNRAQAIFNKATEEYGEILRAVE